MGEAAAAANAAAWPVGEQADDVRRRVALSSRSRSSCASSFCTWKSAATWAEALPLPGASAAAAVVVSGSLLLAGEEEEEEVMSRSSSESCASPRAWSLCVLV